MTRVGALWIGGLEPYMDETFLNNAMGILGQDGVVSIKVMTNKFTGDPAGYGFINFDSDQKAIYVMHRLGGKVIPNSSPPVRFKLNHNSTRLQPGEQDTSIWVGDLTPEVDDFALFQFFTTRYQSVRCTKVVLDENGFSKGYGFVRFGLEAEQQHALANMTGEMGLGSKPIKVSMANQKNRNGSVTNGSGGGGPPPRGTPGSTGNWGGDQGPGGSHPQPGSLDWPASGAAAAGTGGGSSWPAATSPGSGAAAAAGPPMPADYSAYHQYYQQYAQHFSQQQQYQQAAAWSAWQQQQQQQQQQQ